MAWPPALLIENLMKKIAVALGLLTLALVGFYLTSARQSPSHGSSAIAAHESPTDQGGMAGLKGSDTPSSASQSDQTSSVSMASPREIDSQSAPPASLSERLRDLELSAPTDPSAFLAVGSFRDLCASWSMTSQSQNESERSRLADWTVLEEICAADAKERFAQVLAAADRTAVADMLPQPWKHRASTAEEFAARDARLEDQMRRASSAAAAFNAAIVYFDYERFAQWAGGLRPLSVGDDRSYLRSRIGLDVAWMYACRLGLDCGPYAGLTLMECWYTPGCIPGGAARQVVQMRRSPLELRLVDSMVDRLMTERVAVQR